VYLCCPGSWCVSNACRRSVGGAWKEFQCSQPARMQERFLYWLLMHGGGVVSLGSEVWAALPGAGRKSPRNVLTLDVFPVPRG